MLNFGILGLNARNLNYIKQFNPRKSIRLADNKFKTKEFLDERGLPVPRTLALINNRSQLLQFDFGSLHSDHFVIKPNKGSRWRGIFVTTLIRTDETTPTVESSMGFIDKILYRGISFFPYLFKVGDTVMNDLEFKKKLIGILDGQYSLQNSSDTILVEEKLEPGEGFEKFCEWGLADIRVIVFNLVPVVAMVRVPTKYSWGKANLSQGGIGLGIEVGTGIIRSMQFKGELYDREFPAEFAHYKGKKMPFWDDILSYSSRIQYFINIGYLALDRVITDKGPKLLEVNARAGLEVQKITQTTLGNILNKIEDLSIRTPEKWIEIAKTLFSWGRHSDLATSKILYLSQPAKLNIQEDGKTKETLDVVAFVNTGKQRAYASKKILAHLQKNSEIVLDLFQSEIKLRHLKLYSDRTLHGNTIVLGQQAIAQYYVKPQHKSYATFHIFNADAIKESELEILQQIDLQVHQINKKLNLGRILKPVNFLDEFDTFLIRHGAYNPQFRYKFPADEELLFIKKQLTSINKKYFSSWILKSSFSHLFKEKIQEHLVKLDLIQAYKKQDVSAIQEHNIELFGKLNVGLVKESEHHLVNYERFDRKKLGRLLNTEQIKQRIRLHLIRKEIFNVKLETSTTIISRIAIGISKNIRIKLLANTSFREKDLDAIIAHEIDTHLVRYLNGTAKGWNILSSGTGFYLQDEEGLAIYQSMQVMENYFDYFENLNIYKKYHLINQATNYSFQQLVELIGQLENKKPSKQTYKNLFKTALKLKRGIKDTSMTGVVYMKDKVYLDGYTKVKKRVENGWDIDNLLVGKIKIEDLKYLGIGKSK